MNLAVIAITPALLAISLTNAWAQESCSLASLEGQYIFTGRGFIEAVQPGVQRMHYGVFVFDGVGKFAGKQSSSRDGKSAARNSRAPTRWTLTAPER